MNDLQTTGVAEAGMKQLISFTVGAEQYGLELLSVKEIIRMHQITRLPRSPHCVKGVFNLRGEVIPIIDLRDRFGLPPLEQSPTTRIIVVEVEHQPVGLVVDSASQVVRVPASQFEPAPPVIGAAAGAFITGIGRIGEKLIILIDIDKALSAEETSQLARSQEKTASEQCADGRN